VGEVVSGVGLGILTQVTRPWVPTPRGNFLPQVFSGNWAIIQALDLLFSISGSKIMA